MMVMVMEMIEMVVVMIMMMMGLSWCVYCTRGFEDEDEKVYYFDFCCYKIDVGRDDLQVLHLRREYGFGCAHLADENLVEGFPVGGIGGAVES